MQNIREINQPKITENNTRDNKTQEKDNKAQEKKRDKKNAN
tara:strand:+ start:183 stop:305 length:123 start_codon:yes stop_codon:yes gene_type:complete